LEDSLEAKTADVAINRLLDLVNGDYLDFTAESLEEALTAAFEIADFNDDGVLTYPEFRDLIEGLGLGLSDEEYTAMFKKVEGFESMTGIVRRDD